MAFMRGDGKTGFTYVRSIPVGLGPTSVAASDLDRAGRLDLVVVLGRVSAFVVLLGKGDGTFAPPVRYATVTDLGSSLAVGDLNRDGLPDVVVGFYYGPGLQVFLGAGDGTFQAPQDVGDGEGITSVQIARIDGDPWPDLVASSWNSGTIIWYGLGEGRFETTPHYYFAARRPAYEAVGDLDGDGIPDIVTVAGRGYSDIGIRMGNGDRTFRPIATIPLYSPHFVLLADLNGDGKLDIRTITSILLGNGDGTFGDPSASPYVGEFQIVADLDGDGRPELLGANSGLNTVSVLRGDVASASLPVSSSIGDQPRAVLAADIDGDGAKDLVVWEAGGRIRVLRRSANGTFEPSPPIPTSLTPFPYAALLVAADLDRDGFLDVLATSGYQPIEVFLNDGHGGLVSGGLVSDKSSYSLAVVDVDGDGIVDLLSGGLLWSKGDGTGRFGESRALGTGFEFAFAVADMNRDGRPDVVAATYASVTWWLASPTGGLAAPVTFPVPALGTAYRLLVGDVDGDGFPDVITLDSNGENLRLIRGGASGMSATASSLPGRGERAAALFDADGDGVLDIMTVDQNIFGVGQLSAGSSGGRNLACALLPTGGLGPTSLAVMDADGDGVEDVVVCDYSSNNLSYWPVSPSGAVALGDVDGDGDVDVFDNLIIQAFLVGNVEAGHPPFRKPATAADLNASGIVDLYDILDHSQLIVGARYCRP